MKLRQRVAARVVWIGLVGFVDRWHWRRVSFKPCQTESALVRQKLNFLLPKSCSYTATAIAWPLKFLFGPEKAIRPAHTPYEWKIQKHTKQLLKFGYLFWCFSVPYLNVSCSKRFTSEGKRMPPSSPFPGFQKGGVEGGIFYKTPWSCKNQTTRLCC